MDRKKQAAVSSSKVVWERGDVQIRRTETLQLKRVRAHGWAGPLVQRRIRRVRWSVWVDNRPVSSLQHMFRTAKIRAERIAAERCIKAVAKEA